MTHPSLALIIQAIELHIAGCVGTTVAKAILYCGLGSLIVSTLALAVTRTGVGIGNPWGVDVRIGRACVAAASFGGKRRGRPMRLFLAHSSTEWRAGRTLLGMLNLLFPTLFREKPPPLFHRLIACPAVSESGMPFLFKPVLRGQ